MSLIYYYTLFRKAVKLDIFDLNYEFSSESLDYMGLEISGSYKKGILNRIVAFAWHMFKAFKDLLFARPKNIPSHAVIFWTVGKNDNDSVWPICSMVSGGYLVDNSNRTELSFPWFFAYMLSVLFWPLLVINYFKSQGYQRRSFSNTLDYYWCIYGLYITGRYWIHLHKPKAIVFCNLLHPYHRVLQISAKDEGCINIYVQHASLINSMPPFTCDYLLLEGKDALVKAAIAGIEKAKVFLIGMPKHDAYVHLVNTRQKVLAVGICTNGLDPLFAADELVSQLRRIFPRLPVVIRPHDADRRTSLWKKLAQKYNMNYSDSRIEFPFEFLRKIDVVIAGDSNILLEAAMMNVVPIYFDFSGKNLDWYGFYKNGLVNYFSDPIDVCNYLSNIMEDKPNVRTKAIYYNSAINTNIDGYSFKLAAELIDVIISNNKIIDLNKWQRILINRIEAYEYVGGKLTSV